MNHKAALQLQHHYFSHNSRAFMFFLSLVVTFPCQVFAGIIAQPTPNLRVALADIGHGSLLYPTETPGSYIYAPMVDTTVDINITGTIARTILSQTFTNDSDSWVEGLYVFPLPETAAVDQLLMKIGDRLIEGQIKERNQAKQIYQNAKQQGKKASLIEQTRPNLFTNSVANIGPGESISIEIHYQQTIQSDNNTYKIRFPLAITPRYDGQGTEQSKIRSRIQKIAHSDNHTQTPIFNTSDVIYSQVTININLDAGVPLAEIKSIYHETDIIYGENDLINISLSQGQIEPDRDFELVWKPNSGIIPQATLYSEKLNNAYYHYLLLQPPSELMQGSHGLARETIFIIDTSGSMHGTSLLQAKQALTTALNRLSATDRFNIIEFNSITHQLFPKSQESTIQNIGTAILFIKSLQADGGTEMEPALLAAMEAKKTEGFIRQIVFLTDGGVSDENALFYSIEKYLANSRLYTIGIGSAPNSYFMQKAAQFGRGTYTYIGDINEVKTKMSELFNKLESPVMADLNVKWSDGINVDAWPKRLRDLYIGEPITLSAQTDSMEGNLIITGTRLNDDWRINIPLSSAKPASGVAKLWARYKIESLMDELHIGENQDTIRKSVIDTALEHHLVSKFTSLVAVDVTPSKPIVEELHSKNVPLNLPNGMQQQKVLGMLAQTATPAGLHMLVGLMCLFAAAGILVQSVGRNSCR